MSSSTCYCRKGKGDDDDDDEEEEDAVVLLFSLVVVNAASVFGDDTCCPIIKDVGVGEVVTGSGAVGKTSDSMSLPIELIVPISLGRVTSKNPSHPRSVILFICAWNINTPGKV